MADQKITDLADLPVPAGADLFVMVDDVVGTPITKKATLTNMEAVLDHTNITNIGTNAHSVIDTHIADVTGDPHAIAADTLTFTNKTIDQDGAGNSITNIANASIKAAAAIARTKLANVDVVDDTTPELGGEMDCGAHSIGFTQQSATGDGTTTIDWKLGNKFKFTFGAQADTFTFTAPTNPCNILLMLVQDGTGSRLATWPATVKWPGGVAPTLTTAADSIDIIAFYYDGTDYYGVDSLDFS